MPSFSENEIVLVRYPFTDLSGAEVRPAVVVSSSHPSQDIFVVPLTSKTDSLQAGEFVLSNWVTAGLNVPTAVKRGIFTVDHVLVVKTVGRLAGSDSDRLHQSLRSWLGL